jgi:phage terminase large subunit-like protein
LSERQTPVFSESPRIELASNTFENVPVLIQFGDEPLIEMVKDDQPGYTTQIAIYDRNGTYLAKAKGSQLYLTEKGANAGVELRHPGTHLGVIYRALPDDDHDDPATWRKANPSLGVTINEDGFRKDLAKARNNPAELGNFLRLLLNIDARGEGKFIELSDWDACDGWYDLADDAPTYLGLDLSDRNDLTALVAIIGDFESGFNVGCRFWLPRENIAKLERQHQVPYRTWADQGHIELTDGNTIDYEFVKAQILDIASRRNLIKLCTNPYNAKKLAEELLNVDGLPIEYIRQGYLSLSDPTKTLHELIMARKIWHGGHPILRWHASNAVARRDAA